MLTISSAGPSASVTTAMARTPDADFDFLKSIDGARQLLRDEQANRCAYCERRLPTDDSKTKIEHFHPRSKDFRHGSCVTESHAPTADRAVTEWRNLLLVCDGKASPQFTCDTRKGDLDVCDRIHNPKRSNLQIATQVECDHSGNISALNGSTLTQDVLDETLNLNDPVLLRARQSIWSVLMKNVRDCKNPNKKGPKPGKLRERLEAAAQTKEYGSVYLSIAKKL